MSAIAPAEVLIVTRHGDYHALAIAALLRRRAISASIIESNTVAGSGTLSWQSKPGSALLRDSAQQWVAPSAARLTWFRRVGGKPDLPAALDPEAHDLVERDCHAALFGILTTEFTGRYVSNPDATRRAENKLTQLRVAERAGLRIPDTLVSSDPDVVRDFCKRHDYQVIAKTLSGSVGVPTLTGVVTSELLINETIAVSPTIYQQLIPGDVHLRVHVFGDEVYTAMLRSTELDWRYPLDCQASATDLDGPTADKLRRVQRDLGLRMGVFDLKIGPDGQPIWLEVNPQGQFLWIQGLCGINLADAFVDFLERELVDS